MFSGSLLACEGVGGCVRVCADHPMSFALLVSSVGYFFLFCDIPDCLALEDIQYSRSRTESNPWLAPFDLPSPAEVPPGMAGLRHTYQVSVYPFALRFDWRLF